MYIKCTSLVKIKRTLPEKKKERQSNIQSILLTLYEQVYFSESSPPPSFYFNKDIIFCLAFFTITDINLHKEAENANEINRI